MNILSFSNPNQVIRSVVNLGNDFNITPNSKERKCLADSVGTRNVIAGWQQ